MINIVVVDDEQYICNIIAEALDEFKDCKITKFNEPEHAIKFIENNSIDLVLTDLVMGNHSGEKILEMTLINHPDTVVILMTGYPTVRTAISVLRKGGYDYLLKPFKLEDLKATIRRGLEHQRIKRENVELRAQIELMKVNDALARGIKLQPLINLIVDSAVRVVPAQSASILLRDKKSGGFDLQHQSQIEVDKEISAFLRGSYLENGINPKDKQPYLVNDEIQPNGRLLKRSMIAFPLISRGEIIGILNLVCIDHFSHLSTGQLRLISLLAASAAAAVESNFQERNLKKSYMLTIKALANAIEARDVCTAGHTDRVFRIAITIARRMGWGASQMAKLKSGCILHDIGKIGVPDAILNKPGQLDEEEMKVMKMHPELGVKILSGIPFMEPALPYIIAHHEKYDGTGYPYGLRGENIPIEGRLLSVVDTFDAIMSDRPYRPGGGVEKALNELIRFKGTQFDPDIVDVFISAYNAGSISRAIVYGNGKNGQKRMVLNPV
jgi:response regulator RpfG family c-di-GMP phosphodiesterase